uniref:Histidine kinase n=1 Tax=Ascaris lumbricoides TaxID=6252 RepID=A0A0M3ICU1_ASCLU
MSAKLVEGSRGTVISVNAPKHSACENVLKEVAVKCFQGYLHDEPIRFIAATDYHIEGKIEECDGRLAMWECGVNYMYGTFVFSVVCRDAVTISLPIYSGYNASTLQYFIMLVALCSFTILFSYILTVHLREIAEQIRDATD